MTDPHDPTVVRLRQDRAGDVLAFLKANYGAGYYGAEPAYFQWFFQAAPAAWFAEEKADGALPVNAILGADGEILALHAFVPYAVTTPLGVMRGAWDEEWINGSGIRGLGRALPPALLAEVDVYTGVGCNELSEGAFKKLGLDFIPETPRLVAVLDDAEFGALMERAGIDAYAAPRARRPTAAWARLDVVAKTPEAALADHATLFPFAARRDADWLAWRYDCHPYISYHAVSTDNAGTAGVAVVRLEDVVGIAGVRVARIVDLLPRAGHEAAILAAAAAFAADNDCPMIDFHCTGVAGARAVAEWAAEAGLAMADRPTVPFMFQPPQMAANASFNMAIKLGPALDGGIDPADFHATKADSVQDILRDPGNAPRLIKAAG